MDNINQERKIYWDLEPYFIYDYIKFAANLRFFQSYESSYQRYKMKHIGKRVCLVNLFELYQKSLEDLSAILLSFYRRFNQDKDCQYQKDFSVSETPIVYTLLDYKPGTARISEVIKKTKNESDFIIKLGINNVEKINISLLYPNFSPQIYYQKLFSCLTDLSIDQEKRLKMYNKIKHGGVIVGSGKILNPKKPDSPAVLYIDRKAGFKDHPVILHFLKYSEEEFELLKGGIKKISQIMKELLGIYLCLFWYDFLKERNDLKSPLTLLKNIGDFYKS